MKKLFLLASILALFSCGNPNQTDLSLSDMLDDLESIEGTTDYLGSPYVTAGERLYMVGHQDGSFPDLGWHVAGEMGGIWNHPIKLMDGFGVQVEVGGVSYCLDKAETFTNYPIGNKHKFNAGEIEVTRSQFIPDMAEGVYIEFGLRNTSNEVETVDFTFNGFVDLMPVWLGERTNMVDGKDVAKYNESLDGISAKDENNEWYVVYNSALASSAHALDANICDYERKGMGTSASLTYQVNIEPGMEMVIPIAIAGSDKSLSEAITTLDKLYTDFPKSFETKSKRYAEIANSSKLTIPDKKIEEAFRWVKYNTDWLTRDVEGLGRAITAGIPDYPWFFGADSEYALQGAAAVGMNDLVEKTIALIDSVSNAVNEGSGKIIHEMSTNGVVFNPGNLNETPQYAILIWNVFKWTGDMDFLRKYYPTVEAGLKWLLEENDEDGNLLADGYGMMEIHGLESEMIDVAAYTQAAFTAAAEMAEVLSQPAEAKQFRMNATRLKEMINTEFWVEEFDSYADFIGTAKDADHLIDGAIIRADTLNKPWAVEELKATQAKVKQFNPNQKQGFVLYHNWVVNTPMEMGIADEEKAIKALNTGSRYVNPFGVFVTGIDRDESAESDDGGFAKRMKVFSYTGAVMTLPTGVQAIAENNYGRPNKALDYLERMTTSFSFALPGSMYEVSPDFGMIVQAWNIYSYAIPVITQFFGIQPYAHLKEIHINPQMPDKWADGSIENVVIGDNAISVFYEKGASGIQLKIEQTNPEWTVKVGDKEFTQSSFVIEY